MVAWCHWYRSLAALRCRWIFFVGLIEDENWKKKKKSLSLQVTETISKQLFQSSTHWTSFHVQSAFLSLSLSLDHRMQHNVVCDQYNLIDPWNIEPHKPTSESRNTEHCEQEKKWKQMFYLQSIQLIINSIAMHKFLPVSCEFHFHRQTNATAPLPRESRTRGMFELADGQILNDPSVPMTLEYFFFLPLHESFYCPRPVHLQSLVSFFFAAAALVHLLFIRFCSAVLCIHLPFRCNLLLWEVRPRLPRATQSISSCSSYSLRCNSFTLSLLLCRLSMFAFVCVCESYPFDRERKKNTHTRTAKRTRKRTNSCAS